jgi:hypothetical protein
MLAHGECQDHLYMSALHTAIENVRSFLSFGSRVVWVLTASSGTNQVHSRWLALAHSKLRLAQPQLKLLTHCSRYTLA